MQHHTDARKRLPATRVGRTKKSRGCGFKFWTTVNFYDDEPERPGEVFVAIAKEGSDIAGLVDSVCITLSIALQYGVPWDVLREKYLYMRFGADTADKDTNPSIIHAIAVSIDEIVEEQRAQHRPEQPGVEGSSEAQQG